MRFGPTIVGAVIGAAIGVVTQLVLEFFFEIEVPWFAIIIGLLAGLSVRKFDKSCSGHVSYVRGAIAGLIALCAIVGSTYLLTVALKNQAALAKNKPATPAVEPAGAKVTSQGGERQPEPEAPVVPTRTGRHPGAVTPGTAGEFSILQFTFIALGVFLAYELARGTGRAMTPEQQSAESSAPGEQSDEAKEN